MSGLAGSRAPAAQDPVARRMPDGFLWGAATAAYQVEGAVAADGRGRSIWDEFSERPGAVRHGDTGAIACDHYRRWESDLELIGELGLSAYRLSIAWPRVLPEGRRQVNQRGLDHYRRVVDGLLERDVIPAVTLYHWDLPQALEDAGGWATRATVDAFAEQLCAHGRATQVLRATTGQVGIVLNLSPVRPVAGGDGDDAVAAQRVDGQFNRWFLDPLLLGTYPSDLVDWHGAAFDGIVADGDLELIAEPTDFLGVNYYCRSHIRAGDPAEGARAVVPSLAAHTETPDGVETTAMGWPVEPDGLSELLIRLDRDYPGLPPIHITENGAAFDDYVDPEGGIDDEERIAYLESHLGALHDAIRAGVDVRGYFCWSLLDNFEWAEGYGRRFGLIFVDYATQTRTPKASARWYAQVASRNGL